MHSFTDTARASWCQAAADACAPVLFSPVPPYQWPESLIGTSPSIPQTTAVVESITKPGTLPEARALRAIAPLPRIADLIADDIAVHGHAWTAARYAKKMCFIHFYYLAFGKLPR